jgi:hypothetical protein
MLQSFAIACAFAFIAGSAYADQHPGHHQHSAEEIEAAKPKGEVVVSVDPNRVVIQVNGMVCSFCAYGVEKSLSKLKVLDSSQFGGDGVHLDIDHHLVTLALQPGEVLPLEDARKRIRKGGYDPVRFHLRADGALVLEGDAWTLRGAQNFVLVPGELELSPGTSVVLELRVEAADIGAEVVKAVVDAIH